MREQQHMEKRGADSGCSDRVCSDNRSVWHHQSQAARSSL